MCWRHFPFTLQSYQLKRTSFKVEIQNIPPGLLISSEGSLFLLGLLKAQLSLLCLSSQIQLTLNS